MDFQCLRKRVLERETNLKIRDGDHSMHQQNKQILPTLHCVYRLASLIYRTTWTSTVMLRSAFIISSYGVRYMQSCGQGREALESTNGKSCSHFLLLYNTEVDFATMIVRIIFLSNCYQMSFIYLLIDWLIFIQGLLCSSD